MIIEQADRIDLLVFTLPVRATIFDEDVPPLAKAEFMGALFDDYTNRVGRGERLRRVTDPEPLLSRKHWDQVGVMFREGWELWQARYARLIIEGAEAD